MAANGDQPGPDQIGGAYNASSTSGSTNFSTAARAPAASCAFLAAAAMASHVSISVRDNANRTAGTPAGAIDRLLMPRPTSTSASSGSRAASPHTPTGLPTAFPAAPAAAIRSSTAGCQGSSNSASSPAIRSVAIAYCVRSLVPMVSTVHEARAFVERVRSHGLPVAGMMIEVPAAALRARHMMEIVDFASIGTNDLTQYAMATDRMAGELAELLDPWQPAVLDLIAAAGAAGKAVGKPVGVCGEAARDPLLALVLVGLGISSLSMAPAGVPAVRFALSRTEIETCEAMAAAAR